MSCGVYIQSEVFSGQTCTVTFLDDTANITYNLGDKTIPFTFFPIDGTPQGKYFMYFSGSDTTYPLFVTGPCPTPSPTPTVTNTPTQTVTPGLTPTATQSPTPTQTVTPSITPSPTTVINFFIYVSNTSGSAACNGTFLDIQYVFTTNNTSTLALAAANTEILYELETRQPLTGFTYISDGSNYYTVNTSTGQVNNDPVSCMSPSMTPTITQTMTPTPTSSGSGVVPFSFDFDYMLCEYYFTDGQDMDTVTYMTVPSIMETSASDPNAIGPVNGKYYLYVGTCASSSSGPDFPYSPATPFLLYGGDNRTTTGTESVLFDLVEFKTQYPGINDVEFAFTADWYTSPGVNPVQMKVTLWKGGTPQYDPDIYTWTNSGATGTYYVDSTGTIVTLNVQDCEPYELVANLQYNITTFTGQINNGTPPVSPTPTTTLSPTTTPTVTSSPVVSTPTITPTLTKTPTVTPSQTTTPSVTPSHSPTNSLTPTTTPSHTVTPTVTKTPTATYVPPCIYITVYIINDSSTQVSGFNYGGTNATYVSGDPFPLSAGQSNTCQVLYSNPSGKNAYVYLAYPFTQVYGQLNDSNGNVLCANNGAGSQIAYTGSNVYGNCAVAMSVNVTDTSC